MMSHVSSALLTLHKKNTTLNLELTRLCTLDKKNVLEILELTRFFNTDILPKECEKKSF